MGDAGTLSVAAQDTLTGAGVQTVTGAKTFNNQTLKLGNAAGTFTSTLVNPNVSANVSIDAIHSSGAKVTVYNDGTNWIAVRDDGAIISTNSSGTTTIQAALNGLTSGRAYKETVKLLGNMTISKITIPSYTVLDLTGGRLFQANSTDTVMLENTDTTTGNTDIEIIGGEIDGNRANQTGGGAADTHSLLRFVKCSHVNIHDGFWTHANYHCLYLKDCPVDVRVTNNRFENWKQECVCDQAPNQANGVCYGHIISDNYFTHNETGYAAAAVGSCAISTVNVSDLVFANNTVENTMAGSMTTFNGLRQVVSNNVIRNGAGGTGVIGLGTTSTGIILSQLAGTIYDSSGSIIIGNRISNLGKAAIHVSNQQESKDIVIANNIVDGVKDTTANGILVQDGDNCVITGNTVFNNAAAGISLNGNTGKGGVLNAVVSNNICYNNGISVQAQDYRRTGIAVFTTNAGLVNNVLVQGNRCYDNQGTQTQKYGIAFISSSDCITKNNDLRGNLTAPILLTTNTNLHLSSNNGDDYEDQKSIIAPSDPAAGFTRRYAKTVDSNNDGLFVKRKINGAVVEVQL